MTRRRTTRTITFRGGPDDGIVGQHPIGYPVIRANTVIENGEPVAWDEYAGPDGAGAAVFEFVKHVGPAPDEAAARIYFAPAGTPLPTLADIRDVGPWTEVRA